MTVVVGGGRGGGGGGGGGGGAGVDFSSSGSSVFSSFFCVSCNCFTTKEESKTSLLSSVS